MTQMSKVNTNNNKIFDGKPNILFSKVYEFIWNWKHKKCHKFKTVNLLIL